jgi:hypothetical protein
LGSPCNFWAYLSAKGGARWSSSVEELKYHVWKTYNSLKKKVVVLHFLFFC